ncbi:MAG: helix-turn-helix domain-containing protein, partial [Syntrophaceae bacterium]|nr:helix-turn-helix domain-containing protein [Syntrophaceae bacterium]
MNTQFIFKEVFMKKKMKQRASAVQRYLAGENPEIICASLGKTKPWLYKWVARYT